MKNEESFEHLDTGMSINLIMIRIFLFTGKWIFAFIALERFILSKFLSKRWGPKCNPVKTNHSFFFCFMSKDII